MLGCRIEDVSHNGGLAVATGPNRGLRALASIDALPRSAGLHPRGDCDRHRRAADQARFQRPRPRLALSEGRGRRSFRARQSLEAADRDQNPFADPDAAKPAGPDQLVDGTRANAQRLGRLIPRQKFSHSPRLSSVHTQIAGITL
jgi:hypothetical protein